MPKLMTIIITQVVLQQAGRRECPEMLHARAPQSHKTGRPVALEWSVRVCVNLLSYAAAGGRAGGRETDKVLMKA